MIDTTTLPSSYIARRAACRRCCASLGSTKCIKIYTAEQSETVLEQQVRVWSIRGSLEQRGGVLELDDVNKVKYRF